MIGHWKKVGGAVFSAIQIKLSLYVQAVHVVVRGKDIDPN